jgi:hypothetical protein
MTGPVLTEVTDGVEVLTLDRPEATDPRRVTRKRGRSHLSSTPSRHSASAAPILASRWPGE